LVWIEEEREREMEKVRGKERVRGREGNKFGEERGSFG